MADSTLIHGRYQLLEQIGRGGMGQVWRARDEALDRQVAVKCLKPLGNHHEESSLKGLRERFRREARVAAGLQHRGITVVHDFGEDDGVLYLVMELLEGRNLSEVLSARKADPLPEPEVADIAAQIAAALAYTHGQGIIHRDLKPANLMLLADGTVKICDFGIARLAHDIGLSAKLTTTGMAMGTPHYMSPEQISGNPLDFRSDLYSLGCVLYELATGAPPFDLGDPWAILVGHRDTPPEPLRAHRPELSAGLESLILGLLAKDPDDRPADTAEQARIVALDTSRAAEERPESPPRPRTPPPLPGWTRGMRPGSRAGGAWHLHGAAADWSAGLTGHWTGPPATGAVQLAPARREPAPGYLAALAERHAEGLGLGRAGRWHEALQLHQSLLAEREQGLGEEHPDTLDSRYETARALGRLGRWEEALGGLLRVADTRARLLGPRHTATLAARHQAAISLSKLGRPAEALEVYRELMAARTHSLGRSHPETLRARHGLGVSLGRLGRWDEALSEARNVCALRTGALGAEHPDTLVSRREIAVALGWLGRWDEALSEYRPVRLSRERVLGPTHPETQVSRTDEAHCLEQLGRGAEAAGLYGAQPG